MMGIFCAEWLKTKGGALRPLVFSALAASRGGAGLVCCGAAVDRSGVGVFRIFLGLGGAGDAACAGDCGGAAGA